MSLAPRHVALAVALLLVALAPAAISASNDSGTSGGVQPVSGVDAAYTAGRPAGGGYIPSEAVKYEGEPIRVQATSVGRRSLEPTVGVDRKGNAFFAASWHDDSLSMVLPVTQVRASYDGGATWTDVSPRIPVVNEPNPPVNADPYVFVDQDTDRVFQPEAAGACLYMNISDDAGKSWITNPIVCGNGNVDHQSFGVGPFPASLAALKTVYPNVVYYCSNHVADSMCHRSFDGGLTWTGSATPAYLGYDPGAGGLCGGLAGHLDTDSKGRLFLPKGHCGSPWLAVSEDGGNTWFRTRVSNVASAGTHIAVATDAADNVYMLWWDPTHRLPWLAVSKDAGRTFAEPMMVAPPDVREVNFPELEAGDAGKVAVVFPGTTSGNRSDSRRPWNWYTVVTTNALDPEPLFLSTTANALSDPVHRGNCGPGRCPGMWDFIEVTTSPVDGGFWAAVSDTCEAAACKETNGPRDSESSGMGYAIRQIGGPAIRTAPKALPLVPDTAGDVG